MFRQNPPRLRFQDGFAQRDLSARGHQERDRPRGQLQDHLPVHESLLLLEILLDSQERR